MGSPAVIPKLPPGFELESSPRASSSAGPAPPPGFEIEHPDPLRRKITSAADLPSQADFDASHEAAKQRLMGAITPPALPSGAPRTPQSVDEAMRQRYPQAFENPKAPQSFSDMVPKTAGEAVGAAGSFLKGAVVNTASGFADILGRVLQGPQDATEVASLLAGPLGPVLIDMAKGHIATAGKAVDAAKEGDLSSAAGYGAAALIPGAGPAAAGIGEKIGEGHVAEGLGEATAALVGPKVAGKIVEKVRSVPVTPKFTNANAAERSAVAFGRQEGIPVDAATETGSPFVRKVQRISENTPLGAMVGERARTAQTEALTATGKKLAGRVNETQGIGGPQPGPAVVPEQAGEGLRKGLETKISIGKIREDASYDQFRKAEAMPSNAREVPVRHEVSRQALAERNGLAKDLAGKNYDELDPQSKATVDRLAGQMGLDLKPKPVMEKMQLPTDLRSIKAELEPVVESMDKWMEPARRNSSAGYQAARSIVNGPDYVPASVAEAGLGGLKTLSREAKSPDLRDFNSGLAAGVVPKLQGEIDRAVAGAGPYALRALKAGRKFHADKMTTADLLGEIREEPVQAFSQAVWKDDSGIERLRRLSREVPDEMPKVGRAYVEDLLTKATAEGGFGKTGTLLNRWNELGPQTKKILFKDPALVKDLDDFFLLSKKLSENPNPSGSGFVASIGGQAAYLLTNPASGVPMVIAGGALAKLLHSKAGAAALTRGLRVPLKSGPVSAAAVGNILKLAGDAAKPVQLPKAASNDQFEPSDLETTAQAQR